MIKLIASSRLVRASLVTVLTIGTIGLWSVTTHAADTRTEVKHNANGSTTVCKYQTDFATTRDGANVIRTAWVCTTSK